jgi:ligand-binding sensor domain-containing protein
MKPLFIVVCILLSISCRVICAQDAHPAFKHYAVKDGLANPDVYQVKQDSKGYMWFATSYGVSRFNGYEFENFTMNDGLPDNTVFEIFEDHWGKIWFLPLSCKLSYYYNGKIHQYDHNDTIQKCIRKNLKTSFYVDEKGTVFLGILDIGIYEISIDGRIKYSQQPRQKYKTDGSILQITEPGSNQFVYSFNQNFGTTNTIIFDTKFLRDSIKIHSEPHYNVNRIRMIHTKSDKFLIAISNCVFIVNRSKEYEVKKIPGEITWLYEDMDGDLWIGTFLKGVFHIPGLDFNKKRNYLSHTSVDGVWQDHEGGFWFATEGDEVFYTPSKQILTYDKTSGLPDEKINCITTLDGNVYAGSDAGGIIKLSSDKVSISIKKKSKMPDGNIFHFFHDTLTKSIWISGHPFNGLMKNDEISANPLKFYFYTITVDSGNICWLGTTAGLMRLNRLNPSKCILLPIPLNRVTSIINNKDGTIWLGAVDGLWKLNKCDTSVVYLGNKYPLLKNRILDIKVASDQTLLIATKGAGIISFNGRQVYQINSSRGLSNDHVHRLWIRGGDLWAATSKGINQLSFDPVRQKLSIKTYTTENGLPSDEINDILFNKNELWAGSTKGLSVFQPDSFKWMVIDYPLYIDYIKVNSKKVEQKIKAELDYDQNNITIHYTGLGYRDAGNLNYRYKLVGLDTNWVYTKNREIQFTTLPANSYMFMVQVQRSDGNWSTNIASFSFVIYAPFWRTWWFIILLILTSGCLLYLVIRYLFKRKQKQIRHEEEMGRQLLELRSKALKAQMNPHFTFNVMNSIQHYILHNNKEAANKYMTKFSKLIRLILTHSEQKVIMLNEEIKALELYMELEQVRFEESFEFLLDIEPEVEVLDWYIPSMLIQPYVENAIKHGILPAGVKGKLSIRFSKYEDLLKCVIEDNGIGRKRSAELSKNREHRSMGTNITQERLEVMNILYKKRFRENIIDLYDPNGIAMGTRIELYIHIQFTKEDE